MAASKGANTYNRQNWEDSSFPILCETCLGPSPFVRMIKEPHGKECKICNRPFTIFRWCPGPKARFKKTEVCQSCAKLKNVCQTCIFDLEYGLPVEVRDKALRLSQQLPRNDVNREYMHQQIEQQLQLEGDVTAPYGGHQLVGKMLSNTSAASSASGTGGADMLLKLARTAPYYRRNRPHICSFWVKGECRRGEECPYRHEKPTDPDDPLSDQNLRDRYYGDDDPVAAKLLSKYDSMPKLTPPEDHTITTLYIGGIPEGLAERDLRNHFYQFGEIRSVNVHSKQHCAFIQFATRSAAERAAERTYDRLILGGHRLTVNWGKSAAALAATAMASASYDGNESLPPVPGLPLPPSLPRQVSSSSVQAGIWANGGLFHAPPPPPPPPASTEAVPGTVSTSVDLDLIPPPPPPTESRPATTKHSTTPVPEPSPPGGSAFRAPPPPPPLTAILNSLTDRVKSSSSGTALLPPPPPPPLLPSTNTLSSTGAATGKPAIHKDDSISTKKVGSDDKNDGPLGIHYPSQDPQRMGSVPHAEKWD